jgi:hypothetical protein
VTPARYDVARAGRALDEAVALMQRVGWK